MKNTSRITKAQVATSLEHVATRLRDQPFDLQGAIENASGEFIGTWEIKKKMMNGDYCIIHGHQEFELKEDDNEFLGEYTACVLCIDEDKEENI